jgi:hypothetical protein
MGRKDPQEFVARGGLQLSKEMLLGKIPPHIETLTLLSKQLTQHPDRELTVPGTQIKI